MWMIRCRLDTMEREMGDAFLKHIEDTLLFRYSPVGRKILEIYACALACAEQFQKNAYLEKFLAR